MSDITALIADVTSRLLQDRFDDAAIRSARGGEWLAEHWRLVAEQALPLALVQGQQGIGIPADSGLALIGLIGRHVVPLPLAETMMANAILAQVGLSVVDCPVALVADGAGISLDQRGTGWHATGEADRIAWGRNVGALIFESGDRIAFMTSGFRAVGHGENLAKMPRDRLSLDGPVTVAARPAVTLLEGGALVRALLTAGAIEALVDMTVAYVSERVQFGRPLANFQAVQHSLARLASEAASASAAANLAADGFARDASGTSVAIAAARSRISDAAGVAIGLAHQLHGAMGFTEEHRLHWYTTAIWSWRDEFGSAASWTRKLGAAALSRSGPDYWPFIASV